jgi:AcrR family transcriptional regulator
MGRRKLVSNIDDKIMDEVMKMTMKVGTGLVSTKAIAKKLKISEPVIFTHFKTKADLMNATFVKACDPLKNDELAQVALEKGKGATFEDYKPALLWALSLKKETVYIHHYLASSYYDNALALKALDPFFEQMRKVIRGLGGTRIQNETEYNFLLFTYFHNRIDILNTFIQGRFAPDDYLLQTTHRYLVGAIYNCLGIECE